MIYCIQTCLKVTKLLCYSATLVLSQCHVPVPFFSDDFARSTLGIARSNGTLPQLPPSAEDLGPAIHRTQDWQDQVAALHGWEDTWHIWHIWGVPEIGVDPNHLL